MFEETFIRSNIYSVVSVIHFNDPFSFFMWKRASADFLKNFEKLNNHSQQKLINHSDLETFKITIWFFGALEVAGKFWEFLRNF